MHCALHEAGRKVWMVGCFTYEVFVFTSGVEMSVSELNKSQKNVLLRRRMVV